MAEEVRYTVKRVLESFKTKIQESLDVLDESRFGLQYIKTDLESLQASVESAIKEIPLDEGGVGSFVAKNREIVRLATSAYISDLRQLRKGFRKGFGSKFDLPTLDAEINLATRLQSLCESNA